MTTFTIPATKASAWQSVILTQQYEVKLLSGTLPANATLQLQFNTSAELSDIAAHNFITPPNTNSFPRFFTLPALIAHLASHKHNVRVVCSSALTEDTTFDVRLVWA